MAYIRVPETIKFKKVLEKLSLSPSSYKTFIFKNSNYYLLRDLIIKESLIKGQEVGSLSYINNSPYYFIRTKALQEYFVLPKLDDEESVIPILPHKFKNLDIKEGDFLIVKDGNIGEVAFVNQNLPNYMLCGGMYKFQVEKSLRFYIFAFLKNSFFKEQIYNMTSKGATLKHAKTYWLDAKIPFPNQSNKQEIIQYISILMKAIINREEEIKKKHTLILALIEKELKSNQKNVCSYNYPTIKNIAKTSRLDAGFYCEKLFLIQSLIKNYKYGYLNLKELGFSIKRGQNLQVSCIGKSIYSAKEKNNFYKLIKPEFISEYGTILKIQYLGNKNKLSTLRKGDIIFGAEGFKKGRSIMIEDNIQNTITNIHGIIINNKTDDVLTSVLVKCFLDYLRKKGVIDYLAVGGNGGSLAINYFDYVLFPNIPLPKKREIAKLYHNPININKEKLNLNHFEEYDKKVIIDSGILQLDQQLKKLKKIINKCVHKIAMDETIHINFDFIS